MAAHGEARADAATVLEGARSVIVFAAAIDASEPQPDPAPGEVRVARYATGEDYHIVLKERLAPLLDWLAAARPGHHWRIVTDSAPLLERAFAADAGLGFIGRNTMLIAPDKGSHFLLAEIVTTAPIEPDPPIEGTCGTCTRCIEACPTGAIVDEFRVDATRCISYLTIEKKSPLTPGEAQALGPWVFGCDVCQDVCPYNKFAGPVRIGELRAGRVVAPAESATTFTTPGSNREFERRFARSPILRPGRRRLLERVRAALANITGNDARDG